ncbi:glycoside hydrolase family 13 protein [Actinomyces minihominis]|uniref:glycoside hydrolase family 13 protein n=1 Tax=Actinomyces minihominis TaxID=2002838 RepID=UPI000C06CE26|nr:alpha-amylase family glycosyl hydrolase [Actinomyces minihominis]
MKADRNWWRSAVIYQVYPRSFQDSTGSGMGDLAGITRRIDYLAGLGVDALWLSPFYPSPQVDAGYDVAAYCDVDPLFGSLADFDLLLEAAHNRGLRILIDLVPNHSSDQHPLFQAALASPPGSPQRAMYHFVDADPEKPLTPPSNWTSVFGGPSWTLVKGVEGERDQWYYHLFAAEQPDFNWENTAVLTFFEDVLRFWLDRGVDGFRIDVSDALIKNTNWPNTEGGWPDIPKDDSSPVHDIYRHFRGIIDDYPEAMAVIETGAEDDIVALFLREDEMHQAFNFRFLKTGWNGGQIAHAVEESMAAYSTVGAPTTWVTDNHDTTRSVTRYATGTSLSGAYVPTAHDDEDDFDPGEGKRRARAMSVLLLSLPGSAYIYAGQELGLPEVTDLPYGVLTDPAFFRTGGEVRGRDGCRVPLPWSGTAAPFGFSDEAEVTTWLPQPAEWDALTVERQEDDPASMLSLYRHLLQLRRSFTALGTGLVQWVQTPEETATTDIMHIRFHPAEPESSPDQATIDLIMNFGPEPVGLPPETADETVLVSSAPLEGAVLPGECCALFIRSTAVPSS